MDDQKLSKRFYKKKLEELNQLKDDLDERVYLKVQENIVERYLMAPEDEEEEITRQDTLPKIFICYARQDNDPSKPDRKRWLDRLLVHLAPIDLQKQAIIWSDEEIEIGDRWDQKIQSTLDEVRAAVLLISANFLASKYIRTSEVPILLKNAEEKGVLILPIILGPCLFVETKFNYPDSQGGSKQLSLSIFQAANSPSQPLNGLPEHEQDRILVKVAQRLLELLEAEA